MYRYAQIMGDKVHWIMEHEADINLLYEKYFSKDILFVDITGRPEIQECWKYENGSFIEPTSPEPISEPMPKEKLVALDNNYEAQFAALTHALGLASLDNNTALINELQAEYTELKKEYQQEREAILNDC